ncbi:MAG: hypothetical protein ACLQJ7_13190 [Syntrophobacteraceae bacterium]
MKVFGYIIEMLAALMFISALREAKRRDFLDDHGTAKGMKYARKMRAVAVGIRVVSGGTLLMVGLWMVGAFR